jgi:hypothetical protein
MDENCRFGNVMRHEGQHYAVQSVATGQAEHVTLMSLWVSADSKLDAIIAVFAVATPSLWDGGIELNEILQSVLGEKVWQLSPKGGVMKGSIVSHNTDDVTSSLAGVTGWSGSGLFGWDGKLVAMHVGLADTSTHDSASNDDALDADVALDADDALDAGVAPQLEASLLRFAKATAYAANPQCDLRKFSERPERTRTPGTLFGCLCCCWGGTNDGSPP